MFLGGFCRFLPFYDKCGSSSGFCPRLLSSSTLTPSISATAVSVPMSSRLIYSALGFPLCSRRVSSVDHLTLPGMCRGPLNLLSRCEPTLDTHYQLLFNSQCATICPGAQPRLCSFDLSPSFHSHLTIPQVQQILPPKQVPEPSTFRLLCLDPGLRLHHRHLDCCPRPLTRYLLPSSVFRVLHCSQSCPSIT